MCNFQVRINVLGTYNIGWKYGNPMFIYVILALILSIKPLVRNMPTYLPLIKKKREKSYKDIARNAFHLLSHPHIACHASAGEHLGQ